MVYVRGTSLPAKRVTTEKVEPMPIGSYPSRDAPAHARFPKNRGGEIGHVREGVGRRELEAMEVE